MAGDLEPLGPDTVDLLASALAAGADFTDVAMFTRDVRPPAFRHRVVR